MKPTPALNQASINSALRAKLFGKSWVHIKLLDESGPAPEPVYAINWFNTKKMWLYNLYNLLAGSSVLAVGAKPFFKGHLLKTLHGVDEDRRRVLLIVRYPALISFTKMLQSRYFKVVSFLRFAAVQNFTFGFTHRTDNQATPPVSDMTMFYAVHHYRGANDITKSIEDLAQASNVAVYYSGRIAALLYSGDARTLHKQVPCLMEGVILLSGNSQEKLEKFIRSDTYKSIVADTQSSFIGLFNRVLSCRKTSTICIQ